MNPEAIDATKCTALSAGEVAPFTAATGIDAEVVVSIRDGYENLRSAGGDAVRVVLGIDGEDPLEVAPVDNLDGTYTIAFMTTKAGGATLEVSVDGTAIAGSPFAIEVQYGTPVADGMTASVTGGEYSTVAGETRTMNLRAYDAYGNAVLVGGADVVVTLYNADVGDAVCRETVIPSTCTGADDGSGPPAQCNLCVDDGTGTEPNVQAEGYTTEVRPPTHLTNVFFYLTTHLTHCQPTAN